MSNERDNDPDRTLERLFAHAEPRPLPPAADTDKIRRALYEEWDAVTGRRIGWRRAGTLAAAAAGVAVVAWLTVGGPTPLQPGPAVASVERSEGIIGMQVGAELVSGATVFTGSGQLGLRLASGGSLRLGPQTRVQLTGADSAQLVAGAVYFDSEDARAAVPFAIESALGVVRDVGTQFLVRVDPQQLEVGVRDGRVTLERAAGETDVGVGERLIVAAGASEVRRESITAFGDEWSWAERLAPPFEIDGRSLLEFLAWFEAQTGRTVVFADTAAEQASATVLHGSIDLEPLEKLAAVLTLADLDYSLDGERVVIASR
jgi:ferric-dicitrate binding protein FerR (iron transport regulator)